MEIRGFDLIWNDEAEFKQVFHGYFIVSTLPLLKSLLISAPLDDSKLSRRCKERLLVASRLATSSIAMYPQHFQKHTSDSLRGTAFAA